MSDIATKRLLKEAAELKASASTEGIRIKVSEATLFKWEASIDGPKSSPYEGGTFQFCIEFGRSYPMDPPKVKCLTKIFHPNFNTLGDICLDLLQKKWTPLLTAQAVMTSIQRLMLEPNPYDPMMPSIAELAMKSPDEYYRRAKLFTRKYASS